MFGKIKTLNVGDVVVITKEPHEIHTIVGISGSLVITNKQLVIANVKVTKISR